MSYCRENGKDRIIFVTKEDHEEPSTVTFSTEDDEPKGLIADDGSINWECPCLGGMASGPCGVQFREAFSCFHYSKADPKGSDCYEQFATMQDCMSEYPGLYPKSEDEGTLDEDTLNVEKEETPEKEADESVEQNSIASNKTEVAS